MPAAEQHAMMQLQRIIEMFMCAIYGRLRVESKGKNHEIRLMKIRVHAYACIHLGVFDDMHAFVHTCAAHIHDETITALRTFFQAKEDEHVERSEPTGMGQSL